SRPDDSIPPGIESDFDSEEDIIDNLLNDDPTFVIQTFLPYLTYPVNSPFLYSFESEDTIFDPDIST
ncbi:hypothetical protein Tco_1331425, partial [Tanacetum coccineum]